MWLLASVCKLLLLLRAVRKLMRKDEEQDVLEWICRRSGLPWRRLTEQRWKKMYWIDVNEPRRSPWRLSRADDEDVLGWDVKKHLLAMMPHEKRWKKRRCVWNGCEDARPYFPVTFYCNSLLQYVRTGHSWRDVMELSWTIETAYIFTQGGCQVSTWFKIVPAVITLH